MPAVPVTLEILDAAGKVVRTYSSTEPVFDPDPGKDMAAYDEVCKKTPTAAYCGLPLYWPAPQFIVSTKAGMHRFSWDLKFDPVSPADLDARRRRGSDRRGARPHLSELQRAVGAAGQLHRAAHGRRRDEDAADRRCRLDPRVRDRAGGAHDTEHAQHRAVLGGRRRAPRVQRGAGSWPRRSTARSGAAADAVKGELEALAPTGLQRNVRLLRRRGGGPATPSLEAVSNALQAAAMAMQAAEVAPTAAQLAAAAPRARRRGASWRSGRR